jgi:aldehyde dehydrogenase (NAD+)
VVLKPASLTPLSAHHLVAALTEAGLPPGVLNLIYGPGRDIGNTLVDHPAVKAVTFTGSTEVGAEIHRRAASRMIRVQLEMGGKNPMVVLEDADFVKAASIVAVGGFGLTGQACTATSRVIVTPGALEPFVAAMFDHGNRYKPGNGLADGVLMGPVVDRAQMDRNISYVDIARKEGAVVVFGGQPQGDLAFQPTLLGAVQPGHRIATEEVFGPVISLIEASDFEEALQIANDVPFGLSAGICTRDLGKAHQFADRVQAGVVKVNRPTTGLDLNVPFGGIKASSTGTYREQSATATEFFTWSKSVYLGYDV